VLAKLWQESASCGCTRNPTKHLNSHDIEEEEIAEIEEDKEKEEEVGKEEEQQDEEEEKNCVHTPVYIRMHTYRHTDAHTHYTI
jgi:hypothetical protein